MHFIKFAVFHKVEMDFIKILNAKRRKISVGTWKGNSKGCGCMSCVHFQQFLNVVSFKTEFLNVTN